jgi:S-methylmethionine-dependent homocysteine/selenocysteine methylase
MAKMGADLSGYIGQWSVEHPEVSRDLLRDYFRVGCDIVSAGTFNLKERILLDRITILGILIFIFLYHPFGSRNI